LPPHRLENALSFARRAAVWLIFNTWGPHVRRKSLILLDRVASLSKM
jgi:hypothetical protein